MIRTNICRRFPTRCNFFVIALWIMWVGRISGARKSAMAANLREKFAPLLFRRKTSSWGYFNFAMLSVSNVRCLNPRGTVQVCENYDGPSAKFYKEWEPPAGALADIAQNEPAGFSSPGPAGQLSRRAGRFVSPEEAQGHINPGAVKTRASPLLH